MPTETLRDAFRAFTTGCALITTDGPDGPNVMAAEWTFNVSYHPFLILVSMDPGNRTHDLIREAKEFGVSLVSESQAAAMAFAGHHSKSDTDKLSSELFETMPARRIRAPLIRGALLNAECRLVREIPLGDHTGFLGEVVDFAVDPEARPLVLHHGSRHLGERITRAPQVALAVTPMHASAGQSVTIAGELMAADRGTVPVALEVQGPGAAVLSQETSQSTEDGEFRAVVRLPEGTPPGTYTVSARAGAVRGHARFTLGETPAAEPMA